MQFDGLVASADGTFATRLSTMRSSFLGRSDRLSHELVSGLDVIPQIEFSDVAAAIKPRGVVRRRTSRCP
jgi:hypothetical protein